MRDERTTNGHALLLAAGKLVGHVVFAFLEVEVGEGGGCHFETTSFVVAGIDERERDVFDDGERGDEVEILENETDLLGADSGLATRGDIGDRGAV